MYDQSLLVLHHREQLIDLVVIHRDDTVLLIVMLGLLVMRVGHHVLMIVFHEDEDEDEVMYANLLIHQQKIQQSCTFKIQSQILTLQVRYGNAQQILQALPMAVILNVKTAINAIVETQIVNQQNLSVTYILVSVLTKVKSVL